MKQFKCSMSKKKESLTKKSEATKFIDSKIDALVKEISDKYGFTLQEKTKHDWETSWYLASGNTFGHMADGKIAIWINGFGAFLTLGYKVSKGYSSSSSFGKDIRTFDTLKKNLLADCDKYFGAGASESKKSESTDLKGLPISEEDFEKIVKAYCKANSGEGSVPELVEINKVVPVVMDNGEVEGYAVEFAYYGSASGVGMTSYAVVYGDPSKNRDGDTIAFLHNWDSVDSHWLLGAKQVDSEEVAEKDWELANDYIKPSEVIGESHKKSEGIEDQPE